jgi:aminoglycoside phosphotransferase (APT) family kinase protein
MADVDRLCMPHFAPEGMGGTELFPAVPDGSLSKEAMIAQYCKRRGLPFPLEGFDFCVAFSFYRLAVIVHGVASRLSRGIASNGALSVSSATGIANFLVEVAMEITTKAATPGSKL